MVDAESFLFLVLGLVGCGGLDGKKGFLYEARPDGGLSYAAMEDKKKHEIFEIPSKMFNRLGGKDEKGLFIKEFSRGKKKRTEEKRQWQVW